MTDKAALGPRLGQFIICSYNECGYVFSFAQCRPVPSRQIFPDFFILVGSVNDTKSLRVFACFGPSFDQNDLLVARLRRVPCPPYIRAAKANVS